MGSDHPHGWPNPGVDPGGSVRRHGPEGSTDVLSVFDDMVAVPSSRSASWLTTAVPAATRQALFPALGYILAEKDCGPQVHQARMELLHGWAQEGLTWPQTAWGRRARNYIQKSQPELMAPFDAQVMAHHLEQTLTPSLQVGRRNRL